MADDLAVFGRSKFPVNHWVSGFLCVCVCVSLYSQISSYLCKRLLSMN